MAISDRALRRRAHERPLRQLTEHEIDALDRLGELAPFLGPRSLRTALETLSLLAMHEAAQRDHEREQT